jgi:hypothetical protein
MLVIANTAADTLTREIRMAAPSPR